MTGWFWAILGRLYTVEFVILLFCVSFYWKAADFEDAPRSFWAGLSLLTYGFAWIQLGWSIPSLVMGQVGLLLALALARAGMDHLRPPRKPEQEE